MAESKKYEISIQVATQYLPEQSSPEDGRYVFSYTITLENTGTIGAQLVSRHWIISDGREEEQEVKGLGVVGQQPLLAPDETFEVTIQTPPLKNISEST